MQTGKKKDGNTFFSQIAGDRSFTFAGRQNVPRQPTGCHHAAPSPCTLHLIIYIPFNFPQRQMPEGANGIHCQKFQIISQIVMLG